MGAAAVELLKLLFPADAAYVQQKADEQIREEQQKMEEAIIKRAQELAEEHKHQMTNQLYKKTKEQINKRGRKPKTDKPVTTEEGK